MRNLAIGLLCLGCVLGEVSRDRCEGYSFVAYVFKDIQSCIFDVPVLHGRETVTAAMLRAGLQQTCSSRNFPKYVDGMQKFTEQCGTDTKAKILEEVESYNALCESYTNVAGWINEYLEGFRHVEQACLDHVYEDGVLENATYQIEMPRRSEDRPLLSEILPVIRERFEQKFQLIKNHVQTALLDVPGCTATWQDVLLTVLIDLSGQFELGDRLYPEQITQLMEIRRS